MNVAQVYDVKAKHSFEKDQRQLLIDEDQRIIEEAEKENEEEKVKVKPPISLFKSIFGDDDEDD